MARIQTEWAAALLKSCIPSAELQIVVCSSPGDRDQQTDLRSGPEDFFTRDLDEAVQTGRVDCAVHSAKDMPAYAGAGVDWCRLPEPADPRDALILRVGETLEPFPSSFRIGVSSQRREAYCRTRFPNARCVPIRGNIEVRLAKLDRGDVDMLVMAGCALQRLGKEARISEWIPLQDLPTPDGQGSLGLTFRPDDARFLQLRGLFIKSVTFAGAGAGSAQNVTQATVEALQTCDVCLHDALLDNTLLETVSKRAEIIDVGKRCREHRYTQSEICDLITTRVRQGKRVVRLKGGDPGIFGRLAEETEALDARHLPYRVLPAVSSLNAATSPTGLLLTRRGSSTGFCVMTPRRRGEGRAPIDGAARRALPLVLFMSVRIADEVASELMVDGMPGDCPAAVVFDAGGSTERIVSGTLSTIGALSAAADTGAPGLLVVGDPARAVFPRWGPLAGRRIVLTCSEALLPRAVQSVVDAGGTPIPFPLIRLRPAADSDRFLRRLKGYDWIVLSSPSAVRILVRCARAGQFDVREMPRVLVAGARTADELAAFGIRADAVPEPPYGAEAMVHAAARVVTADDRILRLRSDRAGPALAQRLRNLAKHVDDEILYVNEPIRRHAVPPCDAVFFASASAVDAFLDQFGRTELEHCMLVTIGEPTARALRERAGREADVVPTRMTAEAALHELARREVQIMLEGNEC